jgi:hypothetical protein
MADWLKRIEFAEGFVAWGHPHSFRHSVLQSVCFLGKGTLAGPGLLFIPTEAAKMRVGSAEKGSKPQHVFERL